MNPLLFALAAIVVAPGSAGAVQVVPVRYDMPNGTAGAYSYWDESYTGSGCKTCDGALLSGGLGDLTDGVIATANWNIVEPLPGPGPYVGWLDINPTITFYFGGVVAIDQAVFHFDDSQFGGVTGPASVVVNGVTYSVANPPGIEPFTFTVNGLGFSGSELALTINRNGRYTFASEVTFNSAVPELSTLSSMMLGVCFISLLRLRTRAS